MGVAEAARPRPLMLHLTERCHTISNDTEYHRHTDGDVVRGPSVRCIDPDAGAVDVYVIAPDPNGLDLASAWVDYRKDYGVSSGDMMTAHKAFTAGWKAAREGDQAGVLR